LGGELGARGAPINAAVLAECGGGLGGDCFHLPSTQELVDKAAVDAAVLVELGGELGARGLPVNAADLPCA
jgi:hypothetical protein